jgi:hypothetical protein
MWIKTQPRGGKQFDDFVRAPGTHAAVAVLIAALCALTAEGQGLVSFILAGAAVATVAYLGARLFHESRPGRARALRFRR